MIYIKEAENSKAKVLYLMGGTWHTKCMYDLDTVEDSFATILQKKGISTYTFDIVGGGPGPKDYFIGNKHTENVEIAKSIIKEHGIDFILAYSYGCTVVTDMLSDIDVKGLIMLDPFSGDVYIEKVVTDDNDKFLVTKQAVSDALDKCGTNMKPQIKEDYLNNLNNGEDTLVSAKYPKPVIRRALFKFVDPDNTERIFKSFPTKVVFSKNPDKFISSHIPEDIQTCLPNASHWVLLEDDRYTLANIVDDFITKTY